MTWVDTEFYKKDYLHNDTPLIPDNSFTRLADRAFNMINWRNKAFADDFEADVQLKKCICAVAEKLFLYQQAKNGTDADGERIIESFTNKGYSEKFSAPLESYSKMTMQDFNSEIRLTVKEYLNFTKWHNMFVLSGIM